MQPISTLSASPEPAPPVSEPSVLAGRDLALDILKGLLVAFMALYHGINYTAHLALAFKWLAFLPPAFIFITGLLVTWVYPRKYDLHDLRVYTRLFYRGLKLALLFTIMNLGVSLLRPSVDGLDSNLLIFLQQWHQVYLLGSGRVAVFEVLLPIAYFLLLAPFLLYVYARRPAVLPVLSGAVCLACMLLDQRGQLPDNVALLNFGFFGMAIGLIKDSALKKAAACWALTVPLYLMYRALSFAFGETYLIQVSGVFATLLLCYGVAQLLCRVVLSKPLVIMGKYSLVGYIAQILFLQVYTAIWGRQGTSLLLVCSLFLSALLFSWAVAWAIDRLRRCFGLINKGYLAIFP